MTLRPFIFRASAVDRLLTVCDGLIGMPRAQRAALGPMHEGRVDVIGGGAIVIEELAYRATRAGRHRGADGQRARHPGRHRAVDRRAELNGGARMRFEQRFFCSVYSCSLRCPSVAQLGDVANRGRDSGHDGPRRRRRFGSSSPAGGVRGAPGQPAPACLSCATAPAAGGPAMACPAIPPVPIWLNVFAAPASAAGAAAAFVVVSGVVNAVGLYLRRGHGPVPTVPTTPRSCSLAPDPPTPSAPIPQVDPDW